MEIGAGIAIAGTVFAVAQIIISWFDKSRQSQCGAHAMIAKQIENMEDWLAKVEAKLDRVIERL